jgi:hypothetical protein
MKRTVLILALAAGALGIAATTAASTSGTKFTVTSTLDGKQVLPHRIHWIGMPSLPASKINAVTFLIDGKLRWDEVAAPYYYGGHSDIRRNYLVTSWLPPGWHNFTVKAVKLGGHSATDTVRARAVSPPKVPRALAGTWQRKISNTSGAPTPGTHGNPTAMLTPPGRYKITFDRRWIRDVFPCDTKPCRFNINTGGGTEFSSDWTPGASKFTVRGPVTTRMSHDTLDGGAILGGVDRLGGFWCYEDGPAATYSWSVSGTTLTLKPVGGHDACRIRGFIWTGKWKRVR